MPVCNLHIESCFTFDESNLHYDTELFQDFSSAFVYTLPTFTFLTLFWCLQAISALVKRQWQLSLLPRLLIRYTVGQSL